MHSESLMTPAGVDTRVYLNGECFGCVQGISWREGHPDAGLDYVTGDIIYLVLLDENGFNFLRPGDKFDTLVVKSYNEYGQGGVLIELRDIEICMNETGLGVDDIIMEAVATFGGWRAH